MNKNKHNGVFVCLFAGLLGVNNIFMFIVNCKGKYAIVL